MDQRSGDGRVGGRLEIIALHSGYSHVPNFEMLDAKIASALNKIIQNSHFKKKVSLEEQKAQKEDRFLRGRQIAYMIYDHFRLLALMIPFLIMRIYSLSVFVMMKIPPDDVLESSYKLRIRESEQLKTVLELYDMEIHQKISKPDQQKLKTMVKRSTDQKLRLRNFDARNEKIETGAVVTSRRGQRGVERGQ